MRLLLALSACALGWSGCGDAEDEHPWGEQPCAVDLTSQEIAGIYPREDGPPHDVRDATLEARADTVVLEYTTPDGSRFRATYRVTKKHDSRDDFD